APRERSMSTTIFECQADRRRVHSQRRGFSETAEEGKGPGALTENWNHRHVLQANLERTLWMCFLHHCLTPHAPGGHRRLTDRGGAIRGSAAQARLPFAIHRRYAHSCRSCLRRAPPSRPARRPALSPRISASDLPVSPPQRPPRVGAWAVASPSFAYAGA